MQMKMKNNQYDMTKNMLRTMRNLTESMAHRKSINEETNESGLNMDQPEGNVKDDVTVINDVDVKLLSTDEADMELKEDQKQIISKLIDSFRQQVSQLVDFEPGFTINQNQIRLDGKLEDEGINFVFIAGEEAGVYINADMLKLEQNIANTLTKLAKFEETYKTELESLITQRNNN